MADARCIEAGLALSLV